MKTKQGLFPALVLFAALNLSLPATAQTLTTLRDFGDLTGYGTLFKVNTDGTGFTVLKHFSPFIYDPATVTYTNSDGVRPYAGLVSSDGVLYGTAYQGGSSGRGTVFKVNTNGTGFTVLKHFTGSEGRSLMRV